jgi:hypothetical protein
MAEQVDMLAELGAPVNANVVRLRASKARQARKARRLAE